MHPKISAASFVVCSLTLISALFTGCGSSSHVNPAPTNPTPGGPSNPSPAASFSVTGIVPASGATQVPLNSTIQITFSSAANTATVKTTNIKVTDPNTVAGTVTYNASNNTATFTPSAPLVANSTYTVTVSGVTGANGASLSGNFTSTFATTSSGTGGSATVQYQASLLSATAVVGEISVDTSGNVAVQFSGGAPSTSYAVAFCPAVIPSSPSAATIQCLSVGTLTTGSDGSANSTYKFPQAGSWAGDFTLTTGGSASPQFSTYLDGSSTPPKGQVYMATLQPETTTNGTDVLTTGGTQDPLKSGTVTYSSSTQKVTFSLIGGIANISYNTSESETTYLDGSGSYALNNLTTDASGNGTVTTPLDGIGGDIFQISPERGSSSQGYAGYIGGFSVPDTPK